MRLVANNLSVSRGDRTVIAGLSFEVEAGSALVLTGPNGSGKTTLIRTIAGFLRPQAGSIELAGGDNDAELKEQCHYLAHANGLSSNLTVAENIQFWGEYLGDGTPPEVENALIHFDLLTLADIPVRYLSAGQQRRTGLGRLMAAKRPVWLLDEPTVALDAASVDRFSKAVEAHLQQGGIAIAATHVDLQFSNAQNVNLDRQTEVS